MQNYTDFAKALDVSLLTFFNTFSTLHFHIWAVASPRQCVRPWQFREEGLTVAGAQMRNQKMVTTGDPPGYRRRTLKKETNK